MTLVVAETWPSGRVEVVGDLRVTDANELRRGYPFAVLKTVIVSPPMLVGFAGNVPLAMHTLRTLPAQPTNVDVVLPVLEEASRVGGSGPSGVDFVVAVGGQGLWRVTYRQIESKLTRTWIGDASAFSLYQEAYHSLPVSEPLRIPGISPPDPPQIDPQELEGIMRMGNAIASLHFGASTESVGEAFVSATYSGQGFRYQPQAFLAAEHDQVVEEGPWVPADWGTVAEGGFGYALLVPTEPGVGLIGLYFAHAGLGLVYHPLVQDEAFTYSGVSREAFREAILRDHGVSVDGPHLPSA